MHSEPEGAFSTQLAGEHVVLLSERALFWPARRRLVIADLHLGKSQVFRHAGIAIPRGTTQDDLVRLAGLVATTGARELWIVGDVLHGPASQARWRDVWRQWRLAHASLDVAALVGNHDRALNHADLGLHLLGEACDDGPFVFRHLPQADTQGRHVIAGHIHPTARMPGVPRQWPIFWLRRGMTVLPAFSAFTGGYLVEAKRGETLVVCVENTVVPVAP